MERAALVNLVRASGCAIERGDQVFLCDPAWSDAERTQVEIQMSDTVVVPPVSGLGWLAVRTGGSGGAVKFARHDEATLGAAVQGFCEHFGLTQVDAVDVLPAHHVSGLMARVRCAATGGTHLPWDWKQLQAGQAPALAAAKWVISLVPTQLQRLLGLPRMVDWLRQLQVVLVGGGPVWPELADAAQQAGVPLALTYGMTETAAMVCALRPREFLAGARSCGTVMPHVRVRLSEPDGLVTIAGDAVFRGYWPNWDDTRHFTSEDLGRIDERGHLHILGRRDAMILTGGKKVQPADVEAALRASGEFSDVAVLGVPDAEWGEIVVACYPRGDRAIPDTARAMAALPAFQRPKRFVALPEWPRNAQGKVNRATLRAAVLRGEG